jgi:hypothetical protein
MIRIIIAAFSLLCPSLHAVVISSGGPNNTAPSGQPFFNNVGQVGGSTGIYLGNGWVMTANHVAPSLPTEAIFGGISYPTLSNSWTRLTNPSGFSTFTDIVIFRLTAPPALPTLTISNTTPTVGTDVMMIGRGTPQNPETFWSRTVNPGTNDDTWLTVPQGSHNISGFTTTGTREVRWGVNEVHQNSVAFNVGTIPSPIHVLSFTTQFDQGAFTQEAQGVNGDSGGAVFIHNGSSWELAGMMFSVLPFETQPGGSTTAVYGNQTAIADLSVYRSQFVNVIPEPSVIMLLIPSIALLLYRRR